MLSILADALLVATRFDAPATALRHPFVPENRERDLAERTLTKRTWAELAGFRT